MTDTDLEKIAHLDFGVEEEKQEPCTGYSFNNLNTGEILEYKKDCKSAAVLIATRPCCGREKILCLECFNAMCRYVGTHPVGVMHNPCGTKNTRAFLPAPKWL